MSVYAGTALLTRNKNEARRRRSTMSGTLLSRQHHLHASNDLNGDDRRSIASPVLTVAHVVATQHHSLAQPTYQPTYLPTYVASHSLCPLLCVQRMSALSTRGAEVFEDAFGDCEAGDLMEQPNVSSGAVAGDSTILASKQTSLNRAAESDNSKETLELDSDSEKNESASQRGSLLAIEHARNEHREEHDTHYEQQHKAAETTTGILGRLRRWTTGGTGSGGTSTAAATSSELEELQLEESVKHCNGSKLGRISHHILLAGVPSLTKQPSHSSITIIGFVSIHFTIKSTTYLPTGRYVGLFVIMATHHCVLSLKFGIILIFNLLTVYFFDVSQAIQTFLTPFFHFYINFSKNENENRFESRKRNEFI